MLLLSASACSHEVGTKAILDPAKTSLIVVGQSSKADVLQALGPPNRADRNGQGESWVYRVEHRDGSGQQLAAGTQVVSAAVGTFVPFGGLVGAGVGLAGSGLRGSPDEPDATTLTVDFGTAGIVRECTFSTNVIAATAMPAADCSRLLLGPERVTNGSGVTRRGVAVNTGELSPAPVLPVGGSEPH